MTANRIIKTLVFTSLVAGAVIGAWYYRHSAEQKQASAGAGNSSGPGRPSLNQVVTVSVVKVSTGAVNEKLTLTGALKPKEQVDVNPKSTGRVQKIEVNVGDVVKAGDSIAELEREELEQQVRRSDAAISVVRATLAQRGAELANASAQLGRADQLSKDGLISHQDYDALKTQTDVVRAQVRLAEAQKLQAEAELRELKIRLEQTRIVAPMNGVIALRYVDVGALLGPNTPIVRIVNLSTMITVANVPERDVGKLRVGHTAVVRVDAFGPKGFKGRVARISPILDAATRTASIEIEISNPGALLKGEMFARVELDLASQREAVLIPREALVYRGTQPGVYLVKDDRPEFRTIETGLSQGDQVEVLSSLAPGAEIVGKGSSMISEGDRIRVVSANARPEGPARLAENGSPPQTGGYR